VSFETFRVTISLSPRLKCKRKLIKANKDIKMIQNYTKRLYENEFMDTVICGKSVPVRELQNAMLVTGG
jgi:ribosomal protein L31E